MERFKALIKKCRRIQKAYRQGCIGDNERRFAMYDAFGTLYGKPPRRMLA
jgi:hypothetical protein